jgi:hypothetical protein
MSKMKSPRHKKQLAYERDHFHVPEYPHAFRKTWPRAKARAQRAARRKVREVLKTANDDTALRCVRRGTVKKWSGASMTLREIVQRKQQKRKEMVGTRKARQARRNKAEMERP